MGRRTPAARPRLTSPGSQERKTRQLGPCISSGLSIQLPSIAGAPSSPEISSCLTSSSDCGRPASGRNRVSLSSHCGSYTLRTAVEAAVRSARPPRSYTCWGKLEDQPQARHAAIQVNAEESIIGALQPVITFYHLTRSHDSVDLFRDPACSDCARGGARYAGSKASGHCARLGGSERGRSERACAPNEHAVNYGGVDGRRRGRRVCASSAVAGSAAAAACRSLL